MPQVHSKYHSVCLYLGLNIRQRPKLLDRKGGVQYLTITLLWQLSRFASHSAVCLEIERALECLGNFFNCGLLVSRSGWGLRVYMPNRLTGAAEAYVWKLLMRSRPKDCDPFGLRWALNIYAFRTC